MGSVVVTLRRQPTRPGAKGETLKNEENHRTSPEFTQADAQLLFEAWVARLGREQLGLDGYGSAAGDSARNRLFGSIDSKYFILGLDGLFIHLQSASGIKTSAVEQVVDAALERVALGDLGGVVSYTSEMRLSKTEIPIHGWDQFVRVIHDQVRILGSRRLSDVAILDFKEVLEKGDPPDPNSIFAPTTTISVVAFIPGPCASDLTQLGAAATHELIAAVCALSTGRHVTHYPPAFSNEEQDAFEALRRRTDQSIRGLARDHVSMDVFNALAALGGQDAFLRVRGALLAYHAALDQTSADVAVMLLVTSIEALISPHHEWGKQQVTKRFIQCLIELCPGAVDELVEHANTEEAFGYVKRGGSRRRRRDILSLVYDTRSTPTHTGLSPSLGLFASSVTGGSMRVALLSKLAREAILRYIQAPRSSLIGQHAPQDHP